jgi:DNA-binding CsgD family transcriptional regulator
MNGLLVGRIEDEGIVKRLFLVGLLRKYLTDREHAILALRSGGYTRQTIVLLLGIGKTTVYTSERSAINKLKAHYLSEVA